MEPQDCIDLTDALIASRQHVGPKALAAPGPDAPVLDALFRAAAAAPDHNRLRPWRFLVLGPAARARLADVFEAALRERDPLAAAADCERAREKAFRAPVLLLALADLRADDPAVTPAERYVSLGCAIQNLLLAAAARGFACGLSSGRALQSQALRRAYELADGEEAVCFISIGTAQRRKPQRARPEPASFVRWIIE